MSSLLTYLRKSINLSDEGYAGNIGFAAMLADGRAIGYKSISAVVSAGH